MAASYDTVDKIVRVVRKHVDQKVFELIVEDLLEVPGNASFRATVARIAESALKEASDGTRL